MIAIKDAAIGLKEERSIIMIPESKLLDVLLETILPGGIILNALRGSITNQPKKSDLPRKMADETSTAHTIADDIIQEVALSILHNRMPNARVNAEENTQRVKLFNKDTNSLCYHIDPLDGTLSYVQGKNGFAVGAAFSKNRKFMASAIYFPSLDKIFLSQRGNGVIVQNGMGKRLEFNRVISPVGKYIQKRAENLIPVVDAMHLGLFDTMGAHHGMLAIAQGCAKVLMYHLASPHDFGIPQVIVEEAGGICTDLNGEPIEYDSNFSRVPWFLAFFNTQTKNEFFSTMSSMKLD